MICGNPDFRLILKGYEAYSQVIQLIRAYLLDLYARL